MSSALHFIRRTIFLFTNERSIMATCIKVIGRNTRNQLGTSTDVGEHKKLIDGGINSRCTKIKGIASGEGFTIYYDEGYQNIFSAGYNVEGQLANNTFDYVQGDGFHESTFFKLR